MRGLLGVAVAVVFIMRRQDRADRHLRLGGVAIGGALIALVALRAEVIPVLVVLILVGLAVLAGIWFRPEVIRWRSMPGRRLVPLGRTPFVLPALAVVIVALVWPGPEPLTAEQRDTARFGVPIAQHLLAVPHRVLDHTPTTTDVTDRHLATAVPIVMYAHDGHVLTLVVRHSALCTPVEVLLAPAGTNLEIFVVFAPPAAPPPGRRMPRAPAGSTRPTSSPGIPRSRSSFPHGWPPPVSPTSAPTVRRWWCPHPRADGSSQPSRGVADDEHGIARATLTEKR